jgi:membrane-bound lytic murein transglycosylase D
MVMQVFVPAEQDLSRIVVIREDEARVLTVGTDEFFAHFESLKGRKRLEITATEHDTWETIARKYRLSVALLERINRRPRSETLHPGDSVVVYTTIAQPTQVAPATPIRPKASEELAAPAPKQPVDSDVQPEITRAPSEEPQLPPE